MKVSLQILLWLSVVGWGAVLNYCSRYDKVITWAIGFVAPGSLTKQEANIYRAALSPKQYLSAINFQFGLPVLILVVSSYIKWYLGIVGLLVSVLLIYAVLARVMQGTVQGYLLPVILGLERKAAEYKRWGDNDRMEAANDLLAPLKDVYKHIRNKRYKIPPSGSIDVSQSDMAFHERSERRTQDGYGYERVPS